MQEFVEFRQIPATPYYRIVWPVCVELADELGRVFYSCTMLDGHFPFCATCRPRKATMPDLALF